jgi:hypothetical protein
MTLGEWALKHQVSIVALIELERIMIPLPIEVAPVRDAHSEAYVQSLVRLEAGRKGVRLWRNNVGVLTDETGRPVRYGLGNDSPKLNEKLKSGDLIGWRPLIITPEHIGHKIAQFVSRECKKPDWNFTGTDREKAQLKWAQAIVADGGDACFVTGEGSL